MGWILFFSYFSIKKFPLRNALFIDFNFNGRDKMMDQLNYTICVQLEEIIYQITISIFFSIS
jgi:hypothetical protein